MSKKIITILGATGAQGGGLVKAILNDPESEFSVRAITRNINSNGAKKLAELGADVVAADLDDKPSLIKAFKGSYGVYAVTFYWDHFDGPRETKQVENIAKAAKEASVKHVVYSTMEDTRDFVPLNDPRLPILHGKYNIPHFDAKGEADHFFDAYNVPVTKMRTSFYWENFINLGMGPQVDSDNKLIFTLPLSSKKLPGIASEDIGKCAFGIFKRGDEFIGKTVGIAGDHTTGEEFAKAFSSAIGKNVSYQPYTFEQYQHLSFPGADDLANMFEFKNIFNNEYVGQRDIEFSKSLNPEIKSFTEWLETKKNEFLFNEK